MSTEKKNRQQHAIDLLHQADHNIMVDDYTAALECLEFARNILLAELVEAERAAMRRERIMNDPC